MSAIPSVLKLTQYAYGVCDGTNRKKNKLLDPPRLGRVQERKRFTPRITEEQEDEGSIGKGVLTWISRESG